MRETSGQINKLDKSMSVIVYCKYRTSKLVSNVTGLPIFFPNEFKNQTLDPHTAVKAPRNVIISIRHLSELLMLN